MMRARFITPLAAAGVAALAAQPAQAQRTTSVTPYIEIGQVLSADLQSGDVLTYSTVGAGIDASVQTQRTQAQISFRYERDISWSKRVGDQDVSDGLARAQVDIAPGISLEAGALATRTRSDIRGAAPIVGNGNADNISQVYAAYVGPSLAKQVGALDVSASYQFGYTKVESPGSTGVVSGPALDGFGSSTSHVAQASVGVAAGKVLPVGLTVSGAYEREDESQLKQRYEGKYVRGDAVLPVSGTLAVRAGVGYEKIEVSSKDALLDADGNPVIDSKGRYVTDPASPRRIAYDTDGLIYDAGVIWRPSPRTQFQASVGRRYGGTTYVGSFSYAPTKSLAMQIQVYDSVETFGRQLQEGLSQLPTSFITQRDQFGQQFSGCTFSTGSGSAGGCLDRAFQSISTASYRARGVDAIVSASRGPVSFGAGAGYASRRFYAPDTDASFSIDGVTDQSYYAQGFASLALDRRSGIQGNVYADYYESGILNAPGVTSVGATGQYYRNFGRIDTTASLAIYSFSQHGVDSQAEAQAQVSARYSF